MKSRRSERAISTVTENAESRPSTVFSPNDEPVELPDYILGLTPENEHVYRETMAMFSNMEESVHWRCCFQENKDNFKAKVVYKMEPSNKAFVLQAAIEASFNAIQVWCCRMEIDLWSVWHPNVVRSRATGSINHKWEDRAFFENSAAWGLYKSEVNISTHRWINEKEKYFVFRNVNLEPGDDGYVVPKKHRDSLNFAAITTCPDPSTSRVILRVHMKIPIVIPEWAQNWVFRSLTPKLMRLVEKTGHQARDPKYPFKSRIDEDVWGLYAELDKLQQCPAEEGVYWNPDLLL